MNDHEPYQEYADSDVEIVDIHLPASHHAGEESSVMPASARMHSPLAPRFSSRQRRMQLLLTGSIICLLLLMLLGSYTPTRNLILGGLFARSTTTTVSGADLFYIRANPSWGQLTIDGKVIRHLPIYTKDAPLQLAHGHHQLKWVAAPFMEQHCTLSVPHLYTQDTCTLSALSVAAHKNAIWLLTFSASLALLSKHQQLALSQTIQNALNVEQSIEIVQPGERYAVSSSAQHFVVATEPLRATLRSQLDTNADQSIFCINSLLGMPNTTCRINDEDCRLLCTTQLTPYMSSRNIWLVFGVVRTVWDYATLNGKLIARNQPEIDDPASMDEHVLPLAISWDGQRWRVTTQIAMIDASVPNTSPICFPAIDNFQLRDTMSPNIPNMLSYSLQFVASDTYATGCLVAMTVEKPSDSGTIAIAYVLQRFGVFLAANPLAHNYWPELPLADEYEQKVAQQLSIQNTSAPIRWEE